MTPIINKPKPRCSPNAFGGGGICWPLARGVLTPPINTNLSTSAHARSMVTRKTNIITVTIILSSQPILGRGKKDRKELNETITAHFYEDVTAKRCCCSRAPACVTPVRIRETLQYTGQKRENATFTKIYPHAVKGTKPKQLTHRLHAQETPERVPDDGRRHLERAGQSSLFEAFLASRATVQVWDLSCVEGVCRATEFGCNGGGHGCCVSRPNSPSRDKSAPLHKQLQIHKNPTTHLPFPLMTAPLQITPPFACHCCVAPSPYCRFTTPRMAPSSTSPEKRSPGCLPPCSERCQQRQRSKRALRKRTCPTRPPASCRQRRRGLGRGRSRGPLCSPQRVWCRCGVVGGGQNRKGISKSSGESAPNVKGKKARENVYSCRSRG